ncbi:adenosylcobinamide-phosphate synthase CbiB [Geosporobacter ferrireducens]|uniref:Cobalamin biosynthesis protein CobD n=1 Tax=Geosporobacter ferrireducens TaxID=1424294 RepID=A0A1D8GN81_9FIRM|nr:adenosylcobinamide-phosphate synthase CbiB [Geosporobacter ferrireducens]AOT72379.1 cobalamin biosynthesis protein CobD [Geosporobacter ferrireducens]MTI56365.1 cobalamin biosynthesis protein CobD [Geosporobacter ferrireducens]
MIKIFIGYICDLVFGDPYWLPHPIRFIGNGISSTERKLRKFFKGATQEKIGGILLFVAVVSSSYLLTFLLLWFAQKLHPTIRFIVETFLIFQILATKSLDIESRKVYTQLKHGNILEARKYLSYIVGRDTTHLDEKEIVRGAVETVAENISDGIIGPLMYIFIGGAPLGMAYKAVNTLDSMVGYKNEKYLHFGWASAKLDDLANIIPARLTAFFIVISAGLLRYDWLNSFKILKRDRRNHKSPNSGYPEAAVAGALNIQIGGTNSYFGQMMEKPTIGDKLKELDKEDLLRTIRIMYGASAIGVLFFSIIRWMANIQWGIR